MKNLFKRNDEGTAAEVENVDLALTFEAGFAVLAGGPFRFRLSKETFGILSDRVEMAARYNAAENPIEKRTWDDDARRRFVTIARLLKHGLDLFQAAKIIGEGAGETREFYGWAVNRDLARMDPAAAELKAAMEADALPLIPSRVHLSSLDPGLKIERVTLLGPRVAELLRGGSVKSAAETLGLNEDDLQRWIDANSRMIEVLK